MLKIETESSATAAFCFHPFKPLLTTVDERGVVRVINYQMPPTDSKHSLDARAIVNRFHLARGAVFAWKSLDLETKATAILHHQMPPDSKHSPARSRHRQPLPPRPLCAVFSSLLQGVNATCKTRFDGQYSTVCMFG